MTDIPNPHPAPLSDAEYEALVRSGDRSASLLCKALAAARPVLKVRRLHPGAVIPWYQSDGAAGLDLAAIEMVEIPPGMRAVLRTGISVEIPNGYEGQIRPRSGLAAREGLTVLNTPGTIDSDYRGEIKVILINHGRETVRIMPDWRIAQLVIAPVARVEVVEVDALGETVRGDGGLGSTGT